MAETFDWFKPSPMWLTNGSDIREQDYAYFRPRILEFQSDDFVDDFLAAAKSPNAQDLEGHAVEPPEDGSRRKLYLPNHGCFYLVSASLCCRVPHTPDRQVEAREQETVFFVLRKLIAGSEYGWVPAGPNKGWQPLEAGPRTTLPEEQRYPLTPAETGAGRNIWFGYLSVASSDTYNVPVSRLVEMADVGDQIDDTRLYELMARFSRMVETLPTPAEAGIPHAPANISRTMSVFLLLDLWEFLNQPNILPDVAIALRDNPNATFPNDANKAALMQHLRTNNITSGLSLAQAISNVARKQRELELPEADPTVLGFDSRYDLQGKKTLAEGVETPIVNALAPASTANTPVEMPKIEMKPDAAYVVRCIYERPQCTDVPEVVSLATDPFVIARFFDPDAPSRPVKIPMPTDVSVAGLRKFKKGVSFMLSKSMNQKANQVGAGMLKDPPELNAPDGGDFAFICSFSIQIIFIVAFFLLLIFVLVLNFVFWWIAFFKICLPIPKSLIKEG